MQPVRFEPVEAFDLDFVSERAMPACREGIEAMSGLKVRDALRQAADASARKLAARIPEGTVAVFGIGPGRVAGVGHPWMIASDLVRSRTTALYRQARPRLDGLSHGFDRLENWIMAGNKLAMRFQRWIGFEHGPEYRFISGRKFVRFHMDCRKE